jgi:putative DNA primase/helicase
MGHVIQSDRRIAVIVVCRGGGRNGKTALLETLVRLLGQELVAAMRVQDLDRSQFSLGNLLGKLLLYDDDVKAGTRVPDGDLKRLSEAKTVTGERKFGQSFTFRVRTIPILLCNNPPSLADLSEGMRRRLLVVPFDRAFRGKAADRSLFPKIWATELSGILNHALAGLQRVIRRGWRFRVPDSAKAAKAAWLIEANPLPAFIEARCERKGKCLVRDLYEDFSRWSDVMGLTMKQQRLTFRRNLEGLGFMVKHGRGGETIVGLRLKHHHDE